MILDRTDGDGGSCACVPTFEGDTLVLDASDCPGRGDLASETACRERAVDALADREATAVRTRTAGVERAYDDGAVALLVAAGRFADAVAFHDEALAARARRDPLLAAAQATARAGPVADLAAETGLAAAAEGRSHAGEDASTPPQSTASGDVATDVVEAGDRYRRLLRAAEGPTIAGSRVDPRPPRGSRLVSTRELDTGAVARVYERTPGDERVYHLEPVEARLSPDALETLAAAHERLASGTGDDRPASADGHPGRTAPPGSGSAGTTLPGAAASGENRSSARAVRAVAARDDPVVTLSRVLEKHTRGYGALEDCFADARVSDVYATAPVGETPLRAVVDGETHATNVRLTATGARTIASRLRRESGRAFSRASPTLDATASVGDRRVRVAGVADPVSDGVAFAFRDHGRRAWTLPALVANDTLPAGAAALLSIAVERAAAGLVAGTRGAGKTTLLGALLWELPGGTRTVLIEDTPELPVDALLAEGRDVQALRTTTGEDGPGISPTEAMRTALRLGEGALVLGEVRGEEARVLYEAMRVGAGGSAVLGTIHGEDARGVRERVVSDLGVPESSFAATDLVVTCGTVETDRGRDRRVTAIEEVMPGEDGVRFAPLYRLDDRELVATGRIRRGESRLLADCSAPGEGYADVRTALAERERSLGALAGTDRTDPAAVTRAHAGRRW